MHAQHPRGHSKMISPKASRITYFAASLVAALATVASTQAFAGLDLYATGSKISTGNCVNQIQAGGRVLVECSGTLYGIRAQRADSNRWVEFGVSDTGALLFWMSF